MIKPLSETLLCTFAFVHLAQKAAILTEVIQLVSTHDRSAVAELIVKKVSFTGSTTKKSAGTMKKVFMELGDDAPFEVFDAANLNRAI